MNEEQELAEELLEFFQRDQKHKPIVQRTPFVVTVEERKFDLKPFPKQEAVKQHPSTEQQVLGPPGPTITSFDHGTIDVDGGEEVKVFGEHFRSGARIRLGYIQELVDPQGNVVEGQAAESPNVTFINENTLKFITPLSPHEIYVTAVQVINDTGQHGEIEGKLLYQRRPLLGSASPNTGPTTGGTEVTLTGGNFTWFTAGQTRNYILYVSFGGIVVGPAIVLSNTQCKVTTPPHAAGKVDISIVNEFNLKSYLTNGFDYGGTTPPPPPPPGGVPDSLRMESSGPPNTPWGWRFGEIKTIKITAIKAGTTFTTYNGTLQWNVVPYSDKIQVQISGNTMTNGVCFASVRAYNFTPGPSTTNSFDLIINDPQSGLSFTQPFCAAANF